MSSPSLDLTSYDSDNLKNSLIEFLKSKPEFADFDYEGSTLNTIIDVLVRNTHYVGFMSNMIANESFLESSKLRHNVISHAEKLSYTPKSKTASTCEVDIVVTPPENYIENLPYITASKGRSFVSTMGDTTHYFTNNHTFPLYRDLDGNYKASNVELKHGSLIEREFTYNSDVGYVEIEDQDIDTSTLRVYVREGAQSELYEYTMMKDIMLANPEKRFFFLGHSPDNRYRIDFGKNVLGFEPNNNSVVKVEYINTSDDLGNGISVLSAASSIYLFSNIDVTVSTPSFGGAEKESIERIKFLAPKVYQTGNRAVKASDFSSLMMRDFPFVRTASAWGGEENEPQYFGKVMVSAIPNEGVILLDYLKREITETMNDYAVGSITTKFVEPTYFNIDLDISVLVDFTKTSKRLVDITTEIQNITSAYNEEHLKYFGVYYNQSELIDRIIEKDYIKSVEIDKKINTSSDILIGSRFLYKFNFDNQIVKESLYAIGGITDNASDEEYIVDDGEGNVKNVKIYGTLKHEEKIGTIDYENGLLEIDATFLSGDTLQCSVNVVNSNYYTSKNQVVHINNVNVKYIEKGS